MIDKIKNLYLKHKEVILYFVFGIITTVASFVAWWLTIKIGVIFWHDENGDPTMWLDALGSTTQWISGVLVAFFTNRKWVFVNAERGFRVGVRQLIVFSGSRVLTYFIELGMNLAMIELFQWAGYQSFKLIGFEITERLWAKAITAVIVVVANYFISKLLVFRKSAKNKEK